MALPLPFSPVEGGATLWSDVALPMPCLCDEQLSGVARASAACLGAARGTAGRCCCVGGPLPTAPAYCSIPGWSTDIQGIPETAGAHAHSPKTIRSTSCPSTHLTPLNFSTLTPPLSAPARSPSLQGERPAGWEWYHFTAVLHGMAALVPDNLAVYMGLAQASAGGGLDGAEGAGDWGSQAGRLGAGEGDPITLLWSAVRAWWASAAAAVLPPAGGLSSCTGRCPAIFS